MNSVTKVIKRVGSSSTSLKGLVKRSSSGSLSGFAKRSSCKQAEKTNIKEELRADLKREARRKKNRERREKSPKRDDSPRNGRDGSPTTKKDVSPKRKDTWMTVEELQAVNVSLAKGNPVREEAIDPKLIIKRMDVVKEFVERVNGHNLQSAAELVTDDNHWHFHDQAKEHQVEMPWSCWREEMERVNRSFPDFKFRYEKAHYTCGAVVVLQGFRAGGTHTGEPYAFGPCEVIEAKGTEVLNDPEEAYFFFLEGEDNIARVIICPLADSEMTGPAGFYTQLGGFPLL